MVNYYNEWDKGAAAWLRELIKAGHLPQGYVDERSITDVTPSDLEGFTQCHFFAGIGGWGYALQLAGIPASTHLWTGSPPCQPFSVAGKQLGQLDERHLAPCFMRLVDQCRPPILYGEQVAAAIGKHWLDDLFTELERQSYACGAAVLPAASVGAPHKRDRLFFGAVANGHNDRQQSGSRTGSGGKSSGARIDTGRSGTAIELADNGLQRRQEPGSVGSSRGMVSGRRDEEAAEASGRGRPVELADAQSQRRANGAQEQGGSDQILRAASEIVGVGDSGVTGGSGTYHPGWESADWLGCRDGKFRPVEPGSFPLGNGLPARVGRLRGYGNAIVPQVAAEFIKAFTGAIKDAGN